MTRALRYGLIGAVTGLVVLGIGSRTLMRGVTLITGSTPIYSLSGTAEVIASGAWYGVLGGLLLALLPNRRPGWRPWLHWLLFLPGLVLLSSASRSAIGGVTEQGRLIVAAVFALLVLFYSLTLSWITRRTEPSR